MAEIDRSPLPRGVKDIRGQRFGRLVVTSFSHLNKYAIWNLQCDCGNTSQSNCSDLKKCRKSCGCQAGQLRHGHARARKMTRVYRIWSGLFVRCYNRNSRAFKWYGARGIAVCERWRTFENFLADMGEPPPKSQLDRIDNNGNYEPGNCRWTDKKMQMRNMRSNRIITYGGESLCLQEWTEKLRMPHGMLSRRLAMGWTVERAFATPPR